MQFRIMPTVCRQYHIFPNRQDDVIPKRHYGIIPNRQYNIIPNRQYDITPALFQPTGRRQYHPWRVHGHMEDRSVRRHIGLNPKVRR